MISLSFTALNISTITKNIRAKVKWTLSRVRFFSFSVAWLLLMPRISIQKQEVREVIAPSTLGKRAEIRAMMNMTPIEPLKASLNAIVGNRSSGAVEIPLEAAYTYKMPPRKRKRRFTTNQYGRKRHNILLRVLKRFDAYIFLHHLLMQASHGNGNKHTSQQMLTQKRSGLDIGIDDFLYTLSTSCYRCQSVTQGLCYYKNAGYQSYQHSRSL